jgi:hypothetical protein
MAINLGLIGTGEYDANRRPKEWKEGILYDQPNGDAPLTALLSKVQKKAVKEDAEFSWFEKDLPEQRGSITDIFTTVAMAGGDEYVSGAVAGTVLYIKAALVTVQEMRKGHVVMLRDADDPSADHVGKVVDRVENGANSYVAVRMLEADKGAGSLLSGCDRIVIIGTAQAEGSERPDAIQYEPTRLYNYTQIFETSMDITRTARLTKLRTGNEYKRLKKESLELHMIQMEKAFLWGIRTENTGDNGKPERTTLGLVNAIRDNASNNVFDYVTDETYDGETWITTTGAGGGQAWLDASLEVIWRKGSTEKLGFAGNGVFLGIQRLARLQGSVQLTTNQTEWGMKVVTVIMPWGELHLLRHPLFNQADTDRNSLIVFEPKDLMYRPMTDTMFKSDNSEREGGSGQVDGTKESWLTEAGLEYHHMERCGYLTGFNQDNPA